MSENCLLVGGVEIPALLNTHMLEIQCKTFQELCEIIDVN